MPADPIARMVAAALAAADPTPDADLLRRYADGQDPAAFELLVRRHADLVWRVCRGVLRGDHHRAEDAFQATFLALARKAGSVRGPAAGYLFRVARHAALKARAKAARLPDPLPADVPASAVADPTEAAELTAVVAEEVDRLPARLRDPVVLCLLQGHTHAEAADRLGWPVGTVASRLSRARVRLRGRLERRGVVGVLLTAAGGSAPAALVRTTAAVGAGAVPSAAVVSLTNGVLIAMTIPKLKWAAVALMLGLAGGGSLWAVGTGDDPKPAAKAPDPPPKEAAKPAPASIVGTWGSTATSTTTDSKGNKSPLREWEQKTVITGHRIVFLDEEGFVQNEMTYILDPGGMSNTIDFADPATGPGEGIYRVTGNRLRLRWGPPGNRPADFDDADGGGFKRLSAIPAATPQRFPNDDGWFWMVQPTNWPRLMATNSLAFTFVKDADGAAEVVLASATAIDGRPEPEYRVVLFDDQKTRYVPEVAVKGSAGGWRDGATATLSRWRMDPTVLPADKVKKVGIEQRIPGAPAK